MFNIALCMERPVGSVIASEGILLSGFAHTILSGGHPAAQGCVELRFLYDNIFIQF